MGIGLNWWWWLEKTKCKQKDIYKLIRDNSDYENNDIGLKNHYFDIGSKIKEKGNILKINKTCSFRTISH